MRTLEKIMKPHEVLGVSPRAGAEELRAAYLTRIKEFPPDRCPEEFERIRDAYRTLGDPRRRARSLLLGADPTQPFVELLEEAEERRCFAGAEAWLAILAQKSGRA